MGNQKTLITWIETALMAVVAYVLSLLPTELGFFEVYIGLIPLIILGYRRGLAAGLMGGFLWGALKIITGDFYALSAMQVIIEYIVAFTVSGVAGIASSTLKRQLRVGDSRAATWTIIWSVALATFSKYFVHFIAGYVYWSSYAPEGMNPWIYTLIVNGTNALVTGLVCTILVMLIVRLSNRLILTD